MRYYKVYAKCVNRAKAILNVSLDQVQTDISDSVFDTICEHVPEDMEDEADINAYIEAETGKLYSKAIDHLKSIGVLGMGDYEYQALTEKEEPKRSNRCTNDIEYLMEV